MDRPAVVVEHDVTAADAKSVSPSESMTAVHTRRLIILSFWLVVVCLGLPFWLWTTSIHRSDLPLDLMRAWDGGKVRGRLRGGHQSQADCCRLVNSNTRCTFVSMHLQSLTTTPRASCRTKSRNNSMSCPTSERIGSRWLQRITMFATESILTRTGL